jgi:hypothetical protein
VPPIDEPDVQPVDAYPRLWGQEGATDQQVGTKRAVDAAALWRLHVGGGGRVQERRDGG